MRTGWLGEADSGPIQGAYRAVSSGSSAHVAERQLCPRSGASSISLPKHFVSRVISKSKQQMSIPFIRLDALKNAIGGWSSCGFVPDPA